MNKTMFFIHATLPLISSIFVNSQKKLDLKVSASLKKACLHVRLTVQFVMKCNFKQNVWQRYFHIKQSVKKVSASIKG